MVTYPREYYPGVADEDGDNFYRFPGQVPKFSQRSKRRQHYSTVARKAGGVAYLAGRKDVLEITIAGRLSPPDVTTQGETQEIIDEFMHIENYDGEFRLYRFTDRYLQVRWLDNSFPGGRVLLDNLMQRWEMKCKAMSPWWWDTSSKSITDSVTLDCVAETPACTVLPIGGNAPAWVHFSFTVPLSVDCSNLTDIVCGIPALNDVTGEHWWSWGDASNVLNPGDEVYFYPADPTLIIGDSSTPWEGFNGYMWPCGPGDTTICWQPLTLCDGTCTIDVTYDWIDRWNNP